MKVVFYEGLGGSYGVSLEVGIIKHLQDKHPDWTFEGRLWWNWKDLPVDDDRLIVIGHSFGGWRAWKEATQNIRRPLLLLTYDPLFLPWINYNLVPRNDRALHYNFYQTGFLAGNNIKYATENFLAPFKGHVKLVQDDWTFDLTNKIIDDWFRKSVFEE